MSEETSKHQFLATSILYVETHPWSTIKGSSGEYLTQKDMHLLSLLFDSQTEEDAIKYSGYIFVTVYKNEIYSEATSLFFDRNA